MTDPLPQGATIGILGGGQLGRMLSVAAARLGFLTHIYEPGANPPAAQVAHRLTTAPYEDGAALSRFADSVDVITYEFENVPTEALDLLEGRRAIRPGREALRISQDRLTEKSFLKGLGLRTAPFADIVDAASLEAALESIGTPAILKSRRFGYDGKGQIRFRGDGTDPTPQEALDSLGNASVILEEFAPFASEISVIAARGADGAIVCYDPPRNVHEDGILSTSTLPSGVCEAVEAAEVVVPAGDEDPLHGVRLELRQAPRGEPAAVPPERVEALEPGQDVRAPFAERRDANLQDV